MARTALGTRPQPETRTALFAYFAARLAGVPARAFDGHFGAMGVLVRKDGALRAGSAAKLHPEGKRRPGRATDTSTTASSARSGNIFREWLLIDEQRLDLDVGLVRFTGSGRRQSELLTALRHLPGIRQVIETAYKRDVLAITVTAGAAQRRNLRARLEELATELYWDEVVFETHEPAVDTWRELARQAAADEQLLA